MKIVESVMAMLRRPLFKSVEKCQDKRFFIVSVKGEDGNFYLGYRSTLKDTVITRNMIVDWTRDSEIKHEITEEEFLEYIKPPCNCKFGTGYNIVTATKYDIRDEFFTHFKYLGIEDPGDNMHIINNYFTFKYKEVNIIGSCKTTENYFKRACLKCNTCLDEKAAMIDMFEKSLKELDQKIEDVRLVDEICGRQK